MKAKAEGWAADQTQQWMSEVQEEWRREKHRQKMVRLRSRKKQKLAAMVQERRQLERKMPGLVAGARSAIDVCERKLLKLSIQEKTRLLAVESAMLSNENIALQKEIKGHETLHGAVEYVNKHLLQEAASTTSTSLVLPRQNASQSSWIVDFPSQEVPSFYFHPFSSNQVDSLFDLCDARRVQYRQVLGKLFDWTVDYAPLQSASDKKALMATARYTKRLTCSLGYAERTAKSVPCNSWPLLTTPKNWGRYQYGTVCCQVLQEFDPENRVLVYNVPGKVHLRYLSISKIRRRKRADGRMEYVFYNIIADSKANTNEIDVEEVSEHLQWIDDGGCVLTFVEVDEDTIEVVYEHWAGCHSEIRGCEMYIEWIQSIIQFEQYLVPARLIFLANP